MTHSEWCLLKWLEYTVAKTHRMPYLPRSFSTKETNNLWLFCRKLPAIFATLLCLGSQNSPHPLLVVPWLSPEWCE